MPPRKQSKPVKKEESNAERNRVPERKEAKVEEKKEVKLAPPPEGMKYFEAPDGEMVLGPGNMQQLPHRKWGYINPKR